MPTNLVDSMTGLTAEQASEQEREVRLLAEMDRLEPAFWRIEEVGGTLTLVWQLLEPVAADPAAPVDVVHALAAAADAFALPRRLVVTFAVLESSLNPAARAKTSTAAGLLQLTDTSWRNALAKHGARFGIAGDARDDIRAQAFLGVAHIADDIAFVTRSLNRVPQETEAYLCHVLGAPAGCAVLRAAAAELATTLARFYDGTRLGAGFAATVLRANASLMGTPGLTGAGLLDRLSAKVAPATARAEAALVGLAPAQPLASAALADEPTWYTVARQELAAGVMEIPGGASHPRIVEYFSWTRLGPSPDHVPWCAAFVAFCFGKAGAIGFGRGSARASDWLGFGQALATPVKGCLVVLRPQAAGASGHVGFLVREEPNKVVLLGGNQRDAVTEQAFGRGEVVAGGFRMP